jgi:purine-binding chemotaxis protein CheW
MIRVLTFKIEGYTMGIDIKLVKQISRKVEYTPVPDSNPNIIGLYNMRGQIVTLFDIAMIMGLRREHVQYNRKQLFIILKSADYNYVGFLIDEIGDVIDINDDNKQENLPDDLNISDVEFLSFIIKNHENTVMVINKDRIFSI